MSKLRMPVERGGKLLAERRRLVSQRHFIAKTARRQTAPLAKVGASMESGIGLMVPRLNTPTAESSGTVTGKELTAAEFAALRERELAAREQEFAAIEDAFKKG